MEVKTKASELLPGSRWGWWGCSEGKCERSEQKRSLPFWQLSGHLLSPSRTSFNWVTILKTYMRKIYAWRDICVRFCSVSTCCPPSAVRQRPFPFLCSQPTSQPSCAALLWRGNGNRTSTNSWPKKKKKNPAYDTHIQADTQMEDYLAICYTNTTSAALSLLLDLFNWWDEIIRTCHWNQAWSTEYTTGND